MSSPRNFCEPWVFTVPEGWPQVKCRSCGFVWFFHPDRLVLPQCPTCQSLCDVKTTPVEIPPEQIGLNIDNAAQLQSLLTPDQRASLAVQEVLGKNQWAYDPAIWARFEQAVSRHILECNADLLVALRALFSAALLPDGNWTVGEHKAAAQMRDRLISELDSAHLMLTAELAEMPS